MDRYVHGRHGMAAYPAGGWVDLYDCRELLRPLREHHAEQVERYAKILEEADLADAKDVIKRMRKFQAVHSEFLAQLDQFFEPEEK